MELALDVCSIVLSTGLVVSVAALLPIGGRRLPWRLALPLAHTALVTATMALAPFIVHWADDPGYGGFYLPYFIIPGTHWEGPIRSLVAPLFGSLLSHFSSAVASWLVVVILPGLLAIGIGACQWFLIGLVVDTAAARLKAR